MQENGAKAEHVAIILLLAWFILRALYFAVHLSPGMAPDEMFHIQVIEIFARSSVLFPFTGSTDLLARPLLEFSRFGPTTEYPILYQLLSLIPVRLLHLNVFDFSSIVVLRIWNLGISLLNIMLIFKIGAAFLDREARILFYIICTSMLTHTILAASVSYDPLTNLTATCAIYYLLDFSKHHSYRSLMLLICALSLGILTKWSIAPFAAITTVIVIVLSITKLQDHFICKAPKRSLPELFITLMTVLLLACTTLLVVSKYVKYGQLHPSCETIYSPQACTSFNAIIEIHTPDPNHHVVTWWQYPFVWVFYMISSVYGIRSHIGLSPSPELVILIEFFLLLGLAKELCTLRSASPQRKILFCLVVTYSLVLLWYGGIASGFALSDPELGVNGRYAFPILAPLALFLTEGFLMLFQSKIRRYVIILIGALLLWTETPLVLLSDAGKNFVRPRAPEFYRLQDYYPGPVYDREYKRIE